MNAFGIGSVDPGKAPAGVRLASGALLGAVAAAAAWWLLDLVIREHDKSMRILDASGRDGLRLVLVAAAVSAASVALSAFWLSAGLAASIVLLTGIILGGYGSGDPLRIPGGEIGFVVVRGAHEPAIYVLLGAVVTAVCWRVVGRRQPR